jgi:hypothetical protein
MHMCHTGLSACSQIIGWITTQSMLVFWLTICFGHTGPSSGVHMMISVNCYQAPVPEFGKLFHIWYTSAHSVVHVYTRCRCHLVSSEVLRENLHFCSSIKMQCSTCLKLHVLYGIYYYYYILEHGLQFLRYFELYSYHVLFLIEIHFRISPLLHPVPSLTSYLRETRQSIKICVSVIRFPYNEWHNTPFVIPPPHRGRDYARMWRDLDAFQRNHRERAQQYNTQLCSMCQWNDSRNTPSFLHLLRTNCIS